MQRAAPPDDRVPLRVIAEELGVSAEMVRRIEATALRKLRGNLARLGIRPGALSFDEFKLVLSLTLGYRRDPR